MKRMRMLSSLECIQ